MTSFLRNSHVLRLVSQFPKRHLSNLEPVDLAYTTYESENPNRPPLIVNHGLFGSKSNWNSLCKVYQKKTSRTIVSVDARNHGDSPHTKDHSYEHLVVDLKELLNRHLKVEKVALLGHSMGGRAVMYFTLKYPQLVEKLIVVDISPVRTSPNLRKTPELFDVMKKVKLPNDVTLSVARLRVDSQLSQFIEDKGLRGFLLTNLVQKDRSFMWRMNVDTLMSNFEHLATFPHVENVKYEGPVLFIGGGNSDYISRSDHSGISKLFPRAEFAYIEGAGHWVHSEKPTEFLKHTITFLNEG